METSTDPQLLNVHCDFGVLRSKWDVSIKALGARGAIRKRGQKEAIDDSEETVFSRLNIDWCTYQLLGTVAEFIRSTRVQVSQSQPREGNVGTSTTSSQAAVCS